MNTVRRAAADQAPIRTLKEFERRSGLFGCFRRLARATVIRAVSPLRAKNRFDNAIWFPYYHHVFDDERKGFEHHIDFYRNEGEIISLDQAVELISGSQPIDGRYFCITFDDGFKNWIENAVPILVEKKATAAFFLATDYIGTDPIDDRDKLLRFYDDGQALMQFLTWDDCRQMAENGMIIGSHTMTHRALTTLSLEQAEAELSGSKKRIETELGAECRHFCAPFGIPDQHFNTVVHPAMAADIGYSSFLTTKRGINTNKSSNFAIRRDHMMANATPSELRYFMGAPLLGS